MILIDALPRVYCIIKSAPSVVYTRFGNGDYSIPYICMEIVKVLLVLSRVSRAGTGDIPHTTLRVLRAKHPDGLTLMLRSGDTIRLTIDEEIVTPYPCYRVVISIAVDCRPIEIDRPSLVTGRRLRLPRPRLEYFHR